MARLKATTYAGLDSLLPQTGERKIGNNTTAERNENGAIDVYLHGNFIARIWPECVEFTLAGWGTPTTRDRVNQLIHPLGHWVIQRDYTQYLTPVGMREPLREERIDTHGRYVVQA